MTERPGPPDSTARWQSYADSLEAEVASLRQQLEATVKALRECARLSGADLSGGFPTWPDLPTFTVQCVQELRDDYDAASTELA
jgi:hypothetical protein